MEEILELILGIALYYLVYCTFLAIPVLIITAIENYPFAFLTKTPRKVSIRPLFMANALTMLGFPLFYGVFTYPMVTRHNDIIGYYHWGWKILAINVLFACLLNAALKSRSLRKSNEFSQLPQKIAKAKAIVILNILIYSAVTVIVFTLFDPLDTNLKLKNSLAEVTNCQDRIFYINKDDRLCAINADGSNKTEYKNIEIPRHNIFIISENQQFILFENVKTYKIASLKSNQPEITDLGQISESIYAHDIDLSPDGDKIAILNNNQLKVISNTGETIAEEEVPSADMGHIYWQSDDKIICKYFEHSQCWKLDEQTLNKCELPVTPTEKSYKGILSVFFYNSSRNFDDVLIKHGNSPRLTKTIEYYHKDKKEFYISHNPYCRKPLILIKYRNLMPQSALLSDKNNLLINPLDGNLYIVNIRDKTFAYLTKGRCITNRHYAQPITWQVHSWAEREKARKAVSN